MGRLFWKFFFAFWLALLTAGIGVGTAVWLQHNAQLDSEQHPETLINRHAAAFVTAAAGILQYSGVTALHDFLETLRDKPFPPVFAVDERDRDMLDRNIPPEALQQARSLHSQQAYPEAIRLLLADDGHHYLLFVPQPKYNLTGDHRRPIVSQPGKLHDAPDKRPPAPRSHTHRAPPKPPSPLMSITAGTIASLMFSAALAWYFAKPIRSLRSAFAAVARGKLDTRLATEMGKRHDELADLGRDFDHMAAQIGSLVNAQQRLLHDVSHELRSPLARMQAAIGLAQQQPEKMQATLERLERDSQRISDLVGELLVLSRLETGLPDRDISEIDVGGQLADIVEDARFEAEHKGVNLVYTGIEDIIVKGRSELLHRAVENILHNAVQHCKTGGTVTVTADFDKANHRLHISIDDQGPGVAESDLKAIFQPFFRSGSQNKCDSIGLGLTIALRAVQAHGGHISAANRRQGGLHVAIEIPFDR